MEAFEKVASNDGAPGPDRQTIDQVRKHQGTILPALSHGLLEGTYRPGEIRRVWIPKAGGGERGLGIPNVIDRCGAGSEPGAQPELRADVSRE
jgi:retron-type reverse transcriptase